MQVPKTNADVFGSLKRGTKIVDCALQKVQLCILKSMVLVLQYVHEAAHSRDEAIVKHVESLTDAMSLSTAAFALLCQSRKDLARNDIRDFNFHKLCDWKTELGTDTLWKGDVSKTVSEKTKVKPLGSKPSQYGNHKSGYYSGYQQRGGRRFDYKRHDKKRGGFYHNKSKNGKKSRKYSKDKDN